MPETHAHRETSPPSPPPKPVASWYVQGLSDGLGDRLLMFDNSEAPSLELLRFRPDLAQPPAFEAALRDQLRRVAKFQHPAFARVRSVQRLEPDDDLALISNCTPGKRLSEVLHRARGPALAATLIRQLAPALALFQQHAAGMAHGALNADRIVVSPDGRLTIVEQVVGPAIDALNLRAAQLASIGIPLPPSDVANPRLDAAADWYQLALVAVAVLIGRPVTAGELPRLEALLDGLASSARADGGELSPFIRQWLDRALQISGERIESGADGHAAVEELLRKEQSRDARMLDSARADEPPLAPDITADPVPAAAAETAPPEEAAAPQPAAMAAEPAIPAAAPAAVEHEPVYATPATLEPTIAPPPAPIAEPAAPVMPPPATRLSQSTIFEEVRVPLRARPPAPPRPSPPHEALALFEQEARAGRKRVQDLHVPAGVLNRPASAPLIERTRTVSTSLVAALAVTAAVEAGVIGWLARLHFFAPRPALAVQTASSGENLLVANASDDSAALGVAVGSDLRWVRVTTPSPSALPGGKIPTATPGTIRISSPISLRVLERGRVLGSVPGADLKVAAGRHEIELVNAELGYQLTQILEVEAGQTVSLQVAPQHGWATIDASPWADVTIDGKPAGRTPLGPLPLALGEHLITFRNPAGSSDRQKMMVKSGTTTRVTGVLRF